MAKEQLRQLKYLKSEIEMLKKQIDNIKPSTTIDFVKGSSPNFPYIRQTFQIEGIDYSAYSAKVERLHRKLERRINDLIDLVEDMNEFIAGIDNSLVRQILALRYINGLQWEQVAASIGSGTTGESCRKIAERFLK